MTRATENLPHSLSKHRFWISKIACQRENPLKPLVIGKAGIEMSYIITFFVGAWIGAAIGITVMCLLQANRLADREDENEKTNR